ncbi:MAG: hypothetical protein ABIT83_23655 [Massilia sp.]
MTEVAASLTGTPLGPAVVVIGLNLGANREYGYEGHLDLVPIAAQLVASSPQPAAGWTRAGAANQVIGLASFGSDLLALTSDQALWRRPSETPEVAWAHIGEAPAASQIAVWRDRLLMLTSSFQLWATPIAEVLDWRYIGTAFPEETQRPVTSTVRSGATSAVPDMPGGTAAAPSRALNAARTNGLGTNGPGTHAALSANRIVPFDAVRPVEDTSAAAPSPSIDGQSQSAALAPVKWPEHALRLAVLEDRIFVTSSHGVLWLADVAPDAPWRRLDSPGFPKALTQVNGKLLALNKAGEIYMRVASEDLVPWSMLNIEALPGASAIAAIAVSPHLFRVFATTRDNVLWFSEAAPTIT